MRPLNLFLGVALMLPACAETALPTRPNRPDSGRDSGGRDLGVEDSSPNDASGADAPNDTQTSDSHLTDAAPDVTTGCNSQSDCDDGNLCDGTEVCNGGTCIEGTPLGCSDGDMCNGTETCNPSTGCVPGTPLSCGDNNPCNGSETCSAASGCVPGTPITCDDSDVCTTDSCNQTNGMCAFTPISPCGGGPVNDLVAGATIIDASLNSGTVPGSLVGATQQTSGCGGAEVFFRWNFSSNYNVAIDTLADTSSNTFIAYRGTTCTATPVGGACNDNACGTQQSALALANLGPGNHCFSVATPTSGSGTSFTLRFQRVVAASEGNIGLPGNAAYSSSLLTTGGRFNPSCAPPTSSSGEDAYVLFLCPGITRTISATTCVSGTTADTFLSIVGTDMVYGCNDEGPGCPAGASTVSATLTGPGLFSIFADARATDAGAYGISISGL